MKFVSFLIIASAAGIQAFAPANQLERSSTSTAMFLKPEHGRQLAAAFEASTLPHATTEKEGQTVKAARAFAKRVFSLPSTLVHPHDGENEDVVYFPITGFTFCGSKVLPTMSRASCSIIRRDAQDVYGWYSPVCYLESPDSDEYCKNPQTAVP